VRGTLALSLASWACVSTAPPPAGGALEPWEKKWESQFEKKEKDTEKRGNLFIHCEPEDAEIVLDGIPQGSCLDYVSKGLRVHASGDLRRIVVNKQGYWPYEARVVLDRSKLNLRVQLQPLQAPIGP